MNIEELVEFLKIKKSDLIYFKKDYEDYEQIALSLKKISSIQKKKLII